MDHLELEGKMKNIYIAIILSLVAFGCSKKEKETNKETIGKYVYIDSQDILHVKNRCVLGMKITDTTGDSYYKPIERIETIYLIPEDIATTCAWCVDDEQYDQLKKIAYKPKNEIIDYMPEEVYICTGAKAKKYHSHSGCSGFGNCKGDIEAISESQAISSGRTPCKKCY